jgi:hypothetical protein
VRPIRGALEELRRENGRNWQKVNQLVVDTEGV